MSFHSHQESFCHLVMQNANISIKVTKERTMAVTPNQKDQNQVIKVLPNKSEQNYRKNSN